MNLKSIKKDGSFFKLLEIVMNILLINLAYYIAFYLRYDFQPEFRNIEPFYEIIPYISIAAFLIFVSINTFSDIRQSVVDMIAKLSIALFLINITTAAITFFNRGFPFPRSIFLLGFLVQLILLSFFKGIILYYLKRNYNEKLIMVLASEGESKVIAAKLLLNRFNFDNLRYICTDFKNNIYDFIDEVDKIYIGSSVSDKLKSEVISYCIGQNKSTYLVPELFEIAMINANTIQLDDIPVFEIDNLHLSIENIVVKRIFDLVTSSILITITLPIMVFIGLLIKILDPGPVFFVQERVTKGNKCFKLYKFRTMVENAEKKTGPVLAKVEDPRITRLGGFLRSTRLDELPQLFNVFKGDMSIVGPRPERKHFVEKFSKNIPYFRYRVVVKAGITGLAQILGKYTTDPEDKIRFDLLYIRNYSILLDLKIILKTIRVLFTKEKSSGIKKRHSLEDIISEKNIQAVKETCVTKFEN